MTGTHISTWAQCPAAEHKNELRLQNSVCCRVCLSNVAGNYLFTSRRNALVTGYATGIRLLVVLHHCEIKVIRI